MREPVGNSTAYRARDGCAYRCDPSGWWKPNDTMMRNRSRVRYGPSRHQVGVLHRPRHPVPDAPTIVLIHGGFWRWPYNRWLMRLLARDVQRRGWATYNIDYRLLGRWGGGGGWPHTFDDVRAAISMVTAVDAPLGVDPNRIVVVGHSAGGHLALVAAATTERAPALVVSMAGPTDLQRIWDNGSEPVDQLTIGAPTDQRWELTSPAHMLPLGVPILCVHGADDTTVDPDHSVSFVRAAQQAGDEADVVVVPAEVHRDGLRPSSRIWAAVIASIERRMLDRAQV